MSLEVRELETGYGSTQVIWGVSISSGRSGFTAILGPNGAGKTTILNAIMGFIKPWRGVIKYNGVEITHTPPHRKVEMGINIVPEGRRLFPNMSVRENLMLASRVRRARDSIDERLDLVFTLFPILRERLDQKAGTLSGGEQMLAIARTLMTKPDLLLMDEPSQGLAPKIAFEVFNAIRRLREVEKISLLLVEQNISLALEVSEYIYILNHGRIVLEGFRDEILSSSRDTISALIGI